MSGRASLGAGVGRVEHVSGRASLVTGVDRIERLDDRRCKLV